ncbi:EamA family transporter [Ammoniphilus resinae]|uniref:Membrane protein n=1 Tax=Ammoniphilus resinae TaxID=861532 RepID=A0ABS4GTA3_9BACL|nr:EamA family transporter [Ammoniphilus resinae]MBP1933512.1 putative membrane protein [Ammoniphilus resinae]
MFYLSLFFATVVWGMNVIIDKQALKTGHPIEVNFITTMTMAIVVMIYFVLAKKAGMSFAYSPQTISFSILNGILVPTSFVAYLYALSKGDINKVILITATSPIIAILFAVFAFNEQINVTQWFGILMTILGIFLVMR